MPSGAPLILSPLLIFIEFASHISRPIALGMCLAANLTAGHILLAILSDFFSKMLYFSVFFLQFISYRHYNIHDYLGNRSFNNTSLCIYAFMFNLFKR
jgi:F0F1-type ATP synthase membrane subunit a